MNGPALADFWTFGEAEREDVLLRSITEAHAYHYECNTAYRNTVAPRGIGPRVRSAELPRLLRATSQAFTSYADILGTPFPQDQPAGFAEWLAEQVSVDLSAYEHRLRSRYRSLAGLLRALERTYSGAGLELLTSRGTSGRTAIVPRDRTSTDLAVESFSLCLRRYFGVTDDRTAVFMLPKRTRVATARLTRTGVQRVGLSPERVHFTYSLPDSPDRIRVRTGRTYRTGWRGGIERRIWHPVTALLHDRLVDAQAVESAISRLVPAAARGEGILLIGSLTQLHQIASFLLDDGRTMTLPPGSLLITGGGKTPACVRGPAEMRQDLQSAFRFADGESVPARDMYGMAEANWAALQCSHGSYHIPPWVYAVTVDDDEAFQKGPRTTGLLAFFDPCGGGDLFPAFVRTADRVTLVRGTPCPCGEPGSYLEEGSIRPIDSERRGAMSEPHVNGEVAEHAGAAGAAGSTAAGAAGGGADAAHPGFWLPAALRARLITSSTRWEEVRFAKGRECGTECAADEPGAVGARWPLFSTADWSELLDGLRAAREKAPRGAEYWARLQSALTVAARRLTDPGDPYHQALLALPGYTGYSLGTIAAALGDPDLWDLEPMVPALRYQPNKVCGARWQKMPGLPGRIRFFARKPFDQAAGWVPVAWEMPLYRADVRPQTVLALGAGDIPGDGLPLFILALSATLRGEAPLPRPVPPPVVLVRNSAREPILVPLVLSAIEEADPELVSMVAALAWDPDDALQTRLLSEADLVLAAGASDALTRLSGRTAPVSRERRLHAHGHKVSFSVIGREVLQLEFGAETIGWSPPGGTDIIDIVALLTGLDSALWDQNAALSSRVHFVEQAGPADDLPAEYARRLTLRLRQIAAVLPRGAWPRRLLHDPFDRYKAIEGSDRWGTGLEVISDYDDPFVVILDERTSDEFRLDPSVFAALVNECRTRVIVVRPVGDIMEVAWRYLEMLPRDSLQSLSVAVGRPGEGLTRQFLDFATACGTRGVTSIRIAGGGAFPRLAYSWDGLLPVDLVGRRPPGYFTTVDFDAPFDEMMQIYRTHLARLAKIPPMAGRA